MNAHKSSCGTQITHKGKSWRNVKYSKMPTKACQKLCCFYSTELLEAKAKAVGATATSRSLMLLLFVFVFLMGGIQVRGFGGLSETIISAGSVTNLDPSHAVLNCSGTGNSLWKKARRTKLFNPRLCKQMEGWLVSHDGQRHFVEPKPASGSDAWSRVSSVTACQHPHWC